MTTTAKRTYSARSTSTSHPPASGSSTQPIKKRLKSATRRGVAKSAQQSLTQLHFALDSSVLRTCPKCGLSYTRGAPDDEALHRSHCSRVQRGMEWGREEERDALKAGATEIATNVKLKDGTSGRIISFSTCIGGKVGSKLAHLLETINLALVSPPLTDSILKSSKAYLFLLSSASNTQREKIVGCVIAQRISTAMAIAYTVDPACMPQQGGDDASTRPPTHSLVAVDTTSGLFCHPTPLPTPLGIPRLFVSSAHRRRGIASHLLSAAAATFIHGCPLNPANGDVAFTQPTEGGSLVMKAWGKGFVRIYEE